MGGIWKRITGKITDQHAAGGQAVTSKDMQAEGAPPPEATDQPARGTEGQQTPPQQDGST
jgi:hypothetical protein